MLFAGYMREHLQWHVRSTCNFIAYSESGIIKACFWLSCDMLNQVDWCLYLCRDEKNRKRLRIKAGNRRSIDVATDESNHLAKHLKPRLLHKVVAYAHSASCIVMCRYCLP